MFAVDLRETENFTVCERASQSCTKVAQIIFFFYAKRQSFTIFIFRDVGYTLYWSGCVVGGKHFGVQSVIKAGEHFVK